MKNINKTRLIDEFMKYVQIDSETKNEKEMADFLVNELENLGFEVNKLSVPEEIGSNAYNIYAKLAGKGYPILLSSHMDTVTPGNHIKPINDGDYIRSEGDTILGSDDKSGIAAIIEAIRSIKENNEDHRTIEIAFTVYEEGGLHGSKNFDYSVIEAKEAMVFDSGGAIGTIITTAPAQSGLKIKITGKPAHAGLAPEEGINALTVAADAITKMNLSRIDKETTANIGVVRGGQATNIVMPEITLEAEARSLCDQKLDKQVKHMVETFEVAAKKHNAEIDIKVNESYSSFKIADNDEFILDVSKTFEELGHKPRIASTGGGSDANIFNQNGIKTVNLSTGMSKVHTTEEFIKIDDLVGITEFLYLFLTK